MSQVSMFTRGSGIAVIVAGALVAGCTSSRLNWGMVQPHAPSTQSTAVGINAEGVTWFFQCDAQSILSGLRIRSVEALDGTPKSLSIKFDAEPAEESSWVVEKNTYLMRGDAATLLARRTALAYNALLTIDGAPIKFALTGSHNAMRDMTRNCPFLAVE